MYKNNCIDPNTRPLLLVTAANFDVQIIETRDLRAIEVRAGASCVEASTEAVDTSVLVTECQIECVWHTFVTCVSSHIFL